jgi:hypothetical protein
MVVENILQRIFSLYSSGVEDKSERLMPRHIYNKMLSVRSKLIFQKINKKQFISNWSYDYLPCVALEEVSQSNCPCLIPKGCSILRSVEKLPKPVNSISGYMIQSVTSVDGSIIFGEATQTSKNWKKFDKYTSNKPDYFIQDEYLYITVTRKLKAVTVTGIFNDPIEAAQYPSFCDGIGEQDSCSDNPLAVEFSIDEDLIDTLVQMTLEELAPGFGNTASKAQARQQQRQQE